MMGPAALVPVGGLFPDDSNDMALLLLLLLIVTGRRSNAEWRLPMAATRGAASRR